MTNSHDRYPAVVAAPAAGRQLATLYHRKGCGVPPLTNAVIR